jgi:methanol metabolism-related c-type cytochrome
MTKTTSILAICFIFTAPALLGAQDVVYDEASVTAASQEGGRWMTADGVPTYKIEDDGTVDWATFSGFRRYHSECHVCHGPDGEGSSYAPALKNSALTMDYYDFIGVVAGGRQKVGAAENSVMPAFGTNANVMCYLDDIYTYLKARGTNAVDRGRPAKKAEKSAEYTANEDSCMGG